MEEWDMHTRVGRRRRTPVRMCSWERAQTEQEWGQTSTTRPTGRMGNGNLAKTKRRRQQQQLQGQSTPRFLRPDSTEAARHRRTDARTRARTCVRDQRVAKTFHIQTTGCQRAARGLRSRQETRATAAAARPLATSGRDPPSPSSSFFARVDPKKPAQPLLARNLSPSPRRPPPRVMKRTATPARGLSPPAPHPRTSHSQRQSKWPWQRARPLALARRLVSCRHRHRRRGERASRRGTQQERAPPLAASHRLARRPRAPPTASRRAQMGSWDAADADQHSWTR